MHPPVVKPPPQLHWLAGIFMACAIIAPMGCISRNDAIVEGLDPKLAGAEGSARHGQEGEVPTFAPTHGAGGAEVGPRHSLLSLSRSELWAAWNSLRGDAYELDSVERFVEEGSRISCNPTVLVRHSGTHVRYHGSVQIDPAFRDRLIRFEQVVTELASQMYGRAPSRLAHFGAYSCRSSRNRAHRLSEHALGNAIDVTGFDFARASKQQALAAGLPPELSRPFQIRVSHHWNADPKRPKSEVHARFLRELAARLGERDDVFRVMIGPSRPDHSDHFHFDMSPWRYVHF